MSANPEWYELMAREHRKDCLREAAVDEAMRQAGLRRRGWLERPACRLLAAIGRLLVSVGREMESHFATVEPGRLSPAR